MNLLFICTANKLRSATAETIFSEVEGINAIGAGTDKTAPTTISSDLIEWADVIFCMEQTHKNKVKRLFHSLLKNKRLVVLDIPDDYDYMQTELIRLLKARISPILNKKCD
ncbi:MAG: phosphotyrosine protein phosphatase [Alphaproteobacteria bacterium]|nr:phosphotyrosine protein phosphatase [Alphaproteobacteria bacterium]MBP7758718.1 phosphotyrosine protein phosphatase [Alphaproteobacteria bacterium]MBP7761746.1 phosphotyrosine protein phosphatase [Alphaproteobacteria bacterium]MBP7903689.1 phosphotyrosine protein phosphatase [Alphaproteobacteria bacterium]